jgi:hypothetical protein
VTRVPNRLLALAALLALGIGTPLPGQGQAPTGDPDPARRFFASGEIAHVAIELGADERQQLRTKPREYVTAALRLDGSKTPWANVGVKLKGAAGSFQEVDQLPCFTVNLGRFGEQHRLHGLRRFHLNNCVQDSTWLCEWLGSEVFTAAGRPAPRVTHAHVWLDGKDLGLYVLREAYDAQFLQRAFGTAEGSLYDGGFCQDIDGDLEKDAGTGPDDRSDLARLRDACRDGGRDGGQAAPALADVLDVPAFVDFMALEALLGHWDGYCQNRNNFRLWCAAEPGRAQFLPHGMDQILGDPEAPVLQHPSAIVAGQVQQQPEWRQLYRQRLAALLPLLQPKPLASKLAARAAALQQELRTIDRERAAEHAQAVRDLSARIEARFRNLQAQVKAPEPAPLAFRGDQPLRLERWHAAGETDHVELRKRSYENATALQIACTTRGDEERRGAFRTTVMLERGRYRLLATARCEAVEPLVGEGGSREGGAGLAVGDDHSELLTGDCRWTALSCDFEVTEYRRNVELRLELRARAGRVWFRQSSLQLQRLGDR